MNLFFESSNRLVQSVSTEIKRYLYERIDWNQRLTGILGARGTGKTTMMLQYIKHNYGIANTALYVSLDRLILFGYSLYNLADQFYKNGGTHLFLDEVHKYPNWALEIKSIYDDYPSLKIVFSGSSALQLQKAEADLSRRAAVFHLHNLSFREFVLFKTGHYFEPVLFEKLVEDHISLAATINQAFRPIPLFREYLKYGAYPYYFNDQIMFHERLAATVNTIIESDFQAIESFTYQSILSVQKVLFLIADSVPFKPNILELSRKTGISRDILLRMISLLERADLLIMLKQESVPTGYLTKPMMIYLNNPSLMWALSVNREPEIGNIRETFFVNQLSCKHRVSLPTAGDFLVDGQFTFEVGGASKTKKQIVGIDKSYVVQDNIESGYMNTIPLWLFGFLY